MNTLRSWHSLGTGPFLARVVGSGVLAGVASWALVFAVRLFNTAIPMPTGRLLVTAMVRGGVVGGAFGLVLHKYLTTGGAQVCGLHALSLPEGRGAS